MQESRDMCSRVHCKTKINIGGRVSEVLGFWARTDQGLSLKGRNWAHVEEHYVKTRDNVV